MGNQSSGSGSSSGSMPTIVLPTIVATPNPSQAGGGGGLWDKVITDGGALSATYSLLLSKLASADDQRRLSEFKISSHTTSSWFCSLSETGPSESSLMSIHGSRARSSPGMAVHSNDAVLADLSTTSCSSPSPPATFRERLRNVFDELDTRFARAGGRLDRRSMIFFCVPRLAVSVPTPNPLLDSGKSLIK